MDNVKGVVLRVAGKKTVIFTETGDFLKITTPAQTPVTGQVIEFKPKCRTLFNPGNLLKHIAVAAALLLIPIIALIHTIVLPPGGAVAAVEMNIGYGLSLHVDSEGRVASVRATGSESSGIVQELPLKGLDVYEAVKLVMRDAGEKGNFSHEQSIVIVSVTPVNRSKLEVVETVKLQDIVHEELLKQDSNSMVVVASSSREAGIKAENLGMTVNSYLVYERCLRDGLNVSAEVFRGRSVREAINEANLSLAKLFPGELMEVKGQVVGTEGEIIVYTNPVPESGAINEVPESRRIQPGNRGGVSRDNVRMNSGRNPLQGAG